MTHLDDLWEHLSHVFEKLAADLLLAIESRGSEIAAKGGRLVCLPSVAHLQLGTFGLAHLSKLPLGHHRRLDVLKSAGGIIFHIGGKKPLGELLRLFAVTGSR